MSTRSDFDLLNIMIDQAAVATTEADVYDMLSEIKDTVADIEERVCKALGILPGKPAKEDE